MIRPVASTSVAIKGADITVGSIRNIVASIGIMAPTVFAQVQITRMETPTVSAYLDKYIGLVKRRLPQLAQGTAAWWLEQRPFFGGLQRERIWVFWRRVLHTCHHRTQVQSWLRIARGRAVQ